MRNYHKVFDCIKSFVFILFVCGFAYSEDVQKPSFDGKITGRVVEKETGKPLEGVYVGTGDFGDAGGSNMARFANQGKYRHTLTDEQGQFVIEELAIMNHNLVISHIDFVRQDVIVKLNDSTNEASVSVGLEKAGSVKVVAVDKDGNENKGTYYVRLEAHDGHRFMPHAKKQNRHQSSFASSIWPEWMQDSYKFTQLASGKYEIDVFVVDMSASRIRFHGREIVVLDIGEGLTVKIKPQEHNSKIVINLPQYDFGKEGPQFQPLFFLSRNKGLLLWNDDKIRGPEDELLGHIQRNALIMMPAGKSEKMVVENLPAGDYAALAGPFFFLKGVSFNAAKGLDTRVSFPVIEPDMKAQGSTPYMLFSLTQWEKGEYTIGRMCELLAKKANSTILFEASETIKDKRVKVSVREISIGEFLEGICLSNGWKIRYKTADTIMIED